MARRRRIVMKKLERSNQDCFSSSLDTNFKNLPQKIPKIIHQIWIGPKPAPIKLMNTWKEKHPDFEHKIWNEENLKKESLELRDKINEMETFCGKCDIIRLELLYKYGGVYVDADSFCLDKIDENLLKYESFFGYENEKNKPGLISNGNMGFQKNHPLVKNMIDFIKNNNVSGRKTGKMAWETVGPKLFTSCYNSYPEKNNIKILPSHYFLPVHYKGYKYTKHGKVYAHQEWGSTKSSYDNMNSIVLPDFLLQPLDNYSVIIPSLNTKKEYIIECLQSIKNQEGHFGIELIWINDGSSDENSKELENILDNFLSTTRFVTLKYLKWEVNKGISYSLNRAIEESSNEIIFRMDSDDVMLEDRMLKQINYMKSNPGTVWLGGQILINGGKTNLKSYTLGSYKKEKELWICNHPTICFRKKQIMELGGYNEKYKTHYEDFELELRILKKYGRIDNMGDVLLKYRTHSEQVTKQKVDNKLNNLRDLIQKILF
jgi:mannosyltransferase OCH1-like enzyme